MAGTPRKRSPSPKRSAAPAAKSARGRATATKSPAVAQRGTRAKRDKTPHEGAPAASADADRSEPDKLGGAGGEGAPNSPPPDPGSSALAVEIALAGVTMSRRTCVLVQSVRRLAHGLDNALPTDMAKLSKELNARWAELLAEVKPSGPEPADWTKPTPDPAEVRDAAKSRAADKGRGGRRRS